MMGIFQALIFISHGRCHVLELFINSVVATKKGGTKLDNLCSIEFLCNFKFLPRTNLTTQVINLTRNGLSKQLCTLLGRSIVDLLILKRILVKGWFWLFFRDFWGSQIGACYMSPF
jgi:hypothetical protein